MQILKTSRGKSTEKSAAPKTGRARSRSGHTRGLRVVGVYKLSEAIFFTAVGAGAMHLVHKDVGGVLMHVVDALRIDPESRLVSIVMDKVYLINIHQLRRAGVLSFLYAATRVVEGIGLVMEKGWAEYFTVTLTALGLPLESYELVKRYSLYKIGLLVINLVVLLYLIWVLKKKKEEEASAAE